MFPRLAHRTRIVATALLATAALGLTACTGGDLLSSQGDVNTVDKSLGSGIDDAVANAMKLSGSTEAVVGVWSGEQAYVRGYGGKQVDGGTRIRGSQATQPVMCALLLELVDARQVDLDRQISKDLTRQSGIEGITYRQLCDMRSGLADFKQEYTDLFANNPTRFWPEQELVAQGLADSPLEWPGLNMNQSDTNAVLLARVLRVKTGREVPDLLKQYVFDKAGMSSSYYPALSSTTVSGSTLTGLSYPSQGGAAVCEAGPVEVPEVSASMLAGAGATVTTVTDLKRFYESYLGGTFGGDAASIVTDSFPTKNPARDEAGKPTEEVDPATDPQWSFGVEKVGPLYGRSGAITGTLTAAYHDPQSGYSVVVALNNSSAGAGFVKALALQLASVSADAGAGPQLPWSADEQVAALGKLAVCQ
ncbi:serine hydrolase [Leucobacter sp. wl10]|uniref:serine hydrolase domain-containing protein n=1 Tax=Leucobacter sp. wl10 TaxID=2304677 RepID=UPI000E5ADFDA|nr:serine hydrolase domain-containing protein [Leucobacter sp. wl10]RGE19150.1 class A beta-lactamase-related serine hydrolase [Leucobacter sp. wl10]